MTQSAAASNSPDAPAAPTNKVFHHFVPESLNNLIWTNFIAHTNGKEMMIWLGRGHPPGWPAQPPAVSWKTNSLLWGMKGATALSPCWQVESGIGQVPVTALTRRHGYARGHGMGPVGFNTNFLGKKVWFTTKNNQMIEATVVRDVVRTWGTGPPGGDYTLLLFSRDLPLDIEPIRVVSATNLIARFPERPGAPRPIFKTEQGDNVSAEVPPFSVNTWKAGDSGSPDMLPMPGELVFSNGRSTSGPSPEMQADMDELCRLQRLDPSKYQLQWVDISAYPAY
jgi:hypothetical protein